MCDVDLMDEIARDCLAVRIRLLNRVITGIYDEALKPHGVKVGQFNLMVVAGRLEIARPATVCRILKMDASTLSRNLERMRTKGWLAIVPEKDGRSQPFKLTEAGRGLIQAAGPAWRAAQERVKNLLGEEGARAIANTPLNP